MASNNTTTDYDVIIAGGGPVGLMLSCELALRNISVIVLEREVNPVNPWKTFPFGMRGLNTPSVEAFERRGMLDDLILDPAQRPAGLDIVPGFKRGGHFAGIPLNANQLELERWKYRLPHHTLVPVPSSMDQVERVLAKRAEELGVNIVRGNAFSSILHATGDSVMVEAQDGSQYSGKWLVGCDGAHSVVRKAAGFNFIGTEAKLTAYSVDAEMTNAQKLGMMFQPTAAGMYVAMKPGMLHLLDFDGGAYQQKGEPSIEHLQDVLSRVTCTTDVIIKKVNRASCWHDRSMVTSSYRLGRVLLAGDAAHVHPPFGAQGLNAGLGDAMNLAWKLATAVRSDRSGRPITPAVDALLNSYEHERRPVAEAIIEYTQAQMVLIQPDPYGHACRNMVTALAQTVDGANYYLDKFWGLSQRYTPSKDECEHDAVGRSAPNFELEDGTRFNPTLQAGKGLLLDLCSSESLSDVVTKDLAAIVETRTLKVKDNCGLKALLIRPDGITAWATDKSSASDRASLQQALALWFPL